MGEVLHIPLRENRRKSTPKPCSPPLLQRGGGGGGELGVVVGVFYEWGTNLEVNSGGYLPSGEVNMLITSRSRKILITKIPVK